MHMQINVYFYYICIIYLCTNTDTMGNNIKNYFYFLKYDNTFTGDLENTDQSYI